VSDDRRSEYFDAVATGDVDRLRAALERSPDLVQEVLPKERAPMGLEGLTGLHASIHIGSPEMARVLVEHGIDLDVRNAEGRTPLHDAIEHGMHEIEHLLLERGAEVDICAAAILNRPERLRELLDHDPELVNDPTTQLSPLGWASFGNRAEIARELIARGARMDGGELLCAASVGHVEVGRVLLEHGADVDAFGRQSGGNALHAAAGMRYSHNASAFVAMLLEAGADPRIKTDRGMTALDIAERGARQQNSRSSEGTDPGCRKDYEAIADLLRRALARSD
jgi:ankyrin repeat protein